MMMKKVLLSFIFLMITLFSTHSIAEINPIEKLKEHLKAKITEIQKTQKFQRWAQQWINAWNRHDLDGIMSHYADNIELTSPFVVKLMKKVSGTIQGKNNVKAYFKQGLQTYPDLKMELITLFIGIESIVLHYRSVNDVLVAEVIHFNSHDKITKVVAHYHSTKK